jgi:hypothetical protein
VFLAECKYKYMKEMRWTRHVAYIGEKKSGIFNEKTQRSDTFRRLRVRQEDNI